MKTDGLIFYATRLELNEFIHVAKLIQIVLFKQEFPISIRSVDLLGQTAALRCYHTALC